MSTVTEIEQAIATLPVSSQWELYRTLGVRLADQPAPSQPDKRQAVERFLQRWAGAGTKALTDEDLEAQRTQRLTEKYLK